MESSIEMGRRVQVHERGQAPVVKEIWDVISIPQFRSSEDDQSNSQPNYVPVQAYRWAGSLRTHEWNGKIMKVMRAQEISGKFL